MEALLNAAERGHSGNVSSCLDQEGGVHVNSSDGEGLTPLMVAAAAGHEHVVRLLLKRNASVNQQSVYGWTALMQSSFNGHLPVVGVLLQNKADPNLRNVFGASALSSACRNGHVAIASLLLDAGADVNEYSSRNADTATPLMVASQQGHDDLVKLLLERRADVNACLIGTGWTALMLAALNNDLVVCQTLIDFGGADTEMVTCLKFTALDIAVAQGNGEVERYLERRTLAKPKQRIKTVHIDIFEAAKGGHVKRMREILGADPSQANLVDDDGATPLMFSSMKGHVEITELLIGAGANINAQDTISGWTALMQAVYYGRKVVTRLLISHRADVQIQAKEGHTAFDLASIIGDTEVVRILAAVSMKVPDQTSVGNNSPLHPNRIARKKRQHSITKHHTTVLDSSDDGSLLVNGDDRGTQTRFQNWWSRMSSRFRKLTFGRNSPTSKHVNSTRASPTSQPEIMMIHGSRGSSASSGRSSRKSSHTGDHERKVSGSSRSRKTDKDFAYSSGSEAESDVRSLSGARSKHSGAEADSRDSRRYKGLARHIPAPKQLPEDVLAPIIPPFLPAPAFEMNPSGHSGDNGKKMRPQQSTHNSLEVEGERKQTRGMVRPCKYPRTVSTVSSTIGSVSSAAQTPTSVNPPSFGLVPGRGNFSDPSNSGNSGAESSTLTVESVNTPVSPMMGHYHYHYQDSVFAGPRKGSRSSHSSGHQNRLLSASTSNHSPGSSLSSTLVASSAAQQQAIRGSRMPIASSVYSSDTESTLVALHQLQHVRGGSAKRYPSSSSVASKKEEEELGSLMKKLSLEKYTSIFEEQEVDMEAFLTLSDGDLKELGIASNEPRRQILEAIDRLKNEKGRERKQLNETMKSYRKSSGGTNGPCSH